MKPEHTLAIDIETFSSVDLKKCGVYKYAASPDFEILVLAYKLDNDKVRLFQLELDDPDADEMDAYRYFVKMLQDPNILKTAFNAPFERACLSAYFNIELDPAQWECTMAKAYTCGLAGGLDQVCAALHIEGKMKEGMSLIRYFCMPCKPTIVNGGRTRNLKEHAPDKWDRFEQYCIGDVVCESKVRHMLRSFPQTETERRVWILDQQINDRGVEIDIDFAGKAIAIDTAIAQDMHARAVALTGINNPKSVAQLKAWIEKETGEEIEGGLGKEKLPALLKKFPDSAVSELIALRQEMSKTSTKKYLAMLNGAGADHRVRGLLQYYGASRTGRWAGRLVQVQNLPKNEMKDLDAARKLVKDANIKWLDILFDSTPNVLSQLVRTAFIPEPGKKFIVSDFSAIEARVIAWLAGEQWRLDVFKGHGKIYEASAAAMFNVPIETIGKDSPYRFKGKVAELALGYQGGPGALTKMGALKMGLQEDELKPLVDAWRAANPNIVQMWWDVQSLAVEAVEDPGKKCYYVIGETLICFQVKNNVLFITLPSGRQLCYLRPRMVENAKGYTNLTYEGTDQITKQWGRLETYGGKLVENIVQAIARDVLAEAMLRLDKDGGYDIVLHVHDEVVLECYLDSRIEVFDNLMRVVPVWAEGLPLNAESFETYYYKKE